jgi:hypothetical protein
VVSGTEARVGCGSFALGGVVAEVEVFAAGLSISALYLLGEWQCGKRGQTNASRVQFFDKSVIARREKKVAGY